MRTLPLALVIATALCTAGCQREHPVDRQAWSPDADAEGHSAPTEQTRSANASVAAALPLDSQVDFENARRGLVAADDEIRVTGADGGTIWSTESYAFVNGDAPDSVNPSLWRQAKLNGIHGLFEVVPGVHQVRGYDLANMTLIEGETGWILVDPLTATETAGAALDLARRHLGDKQVSAVIFTHSHIDHFGGVASVLPDDEAERRKVRIIAPAGFTHESTSENVIAGVVMLRRAGLMYGMPLARSPRGHVDTGLGKQPARGTPSLTTPTDLVDRTPQEMVIDGVRFVFQYAPESEAPAELTFYLPDKKAYCGAEVVSHNLHNVYTLRGAKVRDALLWSNYIHEALRLFGGEAEVVFNSHHWPVWGNENVRSYLERQRDTYKFIHDQTLRLAARGDTPREIAESLTLPASLAPSFGNRDYYGTVKHNAKAVYQFYFGWYDGNPVNLDPLPPEDAAVRYVELMGGAASVLEKGRAAFDRGELRWAAEVLNHLVFAEPENGEAREALARAYDQLGYRAESGPWRDVYLTAAWELRHGPGQSASALGQAIGLLRQVPVSQFLDAMATRLDAEKAAGEDTVINFVFTDLEESHVLWVQNSVLHHEQRAADPNAAATVRLTHEFFLRLITRQVGLQEALFSDDLELDGSRTALLGFFAMLEQPSESFAIVTP